MTTNAIATASPTEGTVPPARAPIGYVRLSVNITPETAAALKQVAERKNMTVTECVRRAVAVWKLVEDETAQGHRVQIDDGSRIRELVLLT